MDSAGLFRPQRFDEAIAVAQQISEVDPTTFWRTQPLDPVSKEGNGSEAEAEGNKARVLGETAVEKGVVEQRVWQSVAVPTSAFCCRACGSINRDRRV